MSLSLLWTDANGATLELNDEASGRKVMKGARGLDVPPVVNTVSPLVSLDGALLSQRRRSARPIDLPIFLRDSARVQTDVHSLAAALQGPGTLQWDDGTNIRTLKQVIYETGLEGDLARDMAHGSVWRKVVVSLLALDPWWYGVEQTDTLAFGTDITFDDSGTTFDAAAAFNGDTVSSVTISGDNYALPLFTIEGPFSTCIIIINGTSTIELAAALADGDTITVDTAPGNRGPRFNNGPIDWSLLTSDSRLPTLPVGSTTVATQTSGTGGNSNIEMTYAERWLTP